MAAAIGLIALGLFAPVAGAYLGLVGGLGATGDGDGQFRSPFGVATDGSGNGYVADVTLRRVQKFTSSGAFVLKWGHGPQGVLADGDFLTPGGVAVDQRTGEVYVTDRQANRVQKFSASGQFLAKWGRNGGDGTAGRATGEFSAPLGVAVDPTGNVYVADGAVMPLMPGDLSRIQKFSPSGQFITQWQVSGLPVSGMATDAGGTLYAANAVLGVQKYDYNGTGRGRIQPLPPPFDPYTHSPAAPQALDAAVDPRDGAVWLVNPAGPRLEKYRPDGRLIGLCSLVTARGDLLGGVGTIAIGPTGDIYAPFIHLGEVGPPALSCDPPPSMSRVRLAPARFRAARRPRAGGRGAYLHFQVNKETTISIVVEHGFPGRRVHGRCLRTRARGRARPCIAYRRQGTLSQRSRFRGGFEETARITGWLGARRLATGVYRMQVSAIDLLKRRSTPKVLPFTVVR